MHDLALTCDPETSGASWKSGVRHPACKRPPVSMADRNPPGSRLMETIRTSACNEAQRQAPPVSAEVWMAIKPLLVAGEAPAPGDLV